MPCKNCGHNVENGSNYCSQCGQVIQGWTIVDYLKGNFQIFAVIGVFGAISLYLASFAENSGSNSWLKAGSLLSLSLVVLLSLGLVFRIVPYLRNCAAQEGHMEKSYRSWFKLSWEITQIIVFGVVYLFIFCLMAAYLLFDSEMGSTLLSNLVALIFLLLMLAGVYLPAIHIIKTKERFKPLFLGIVVMSVGSFIYYLWYILSDISKAYFLYPIPLVSLLTIYGCYELYKDRVNESSLNSSSVEDTHPVDETREGKSETG